MQTDIFTKPTKANAVKQKLQQAGHEGVSNWDLNQITFRYGAVIHKLRKEGHIILTIPVDPRNGHYKFIWKGQR